MSRRTAAAGWGGERVGGLRLTTNKQNKHAKLPRRPRSRAAPFANRRLSYLYKSHFTAAREIGRKSRLFFFFFSCSSLPRLARARLPRNGGRATTLGGVRPENSLRRYYSIRFYLRTGTCKTLACRAPEGREKSLQPP